MSIRKHIFIYYKYKTANGVVDDAVRRSYQRVIYFQNALLLRYAR